MDKTLFFMGGIMEEKFEMLKDLTMKEIKLTDACEFLELSQLEVLSLIRQLRLEGINIVSQVKDDDIYIFNQGEREVFLPF